MIGPRRILLGGKGQVLAALPGIDGAFDIGLLVPVDSVDVAVRSGFWRLGHVSGSSSPSEPAAALASFEKIFL
jgi:hypothetical protein